MFSNNKEINTRICENLQLQKEYGYYNYFEIMRIDRLKIETNGAFNQFEQIKMLINPPFVVMTFFKDRLIHPNYNNQVLERLTT